MSFVDAEPEMPAMATGDLRGIGSAVSAGNAAATAPTTGVIPGAADEVSALAATQFPARARMHQAVSAAAIHEMFATTLGASAGSCAATKAANALAVS